MDTDALARVFAGLDRELWLITAQSGGRRGGLIATFVSLASLVPELPRVVVGLAKQHHTHERIAERRTFAMHLIAESQLDRVWRFGLQSGRDVDKLDGLATVPGRLGAPILIDAPVAMDCRVEATLDTGDRTLFLAEIVDARIAPDVPPLTVRRMLELAPPDRLDDLNRGLVRDIAVDARAIHDYRNKASRST